MVVEMGFDEITGMLQGLEVAAWVGLELCWLFRRVGKYPSDPADNDSRTSAPETSRVRQLHFPQITLDISHASR